LQIAIPKGKRLTAPPDSKSAMRVDKADIDGKTKDLEFGVPEPTAFRNPLALDSKRLVFLSIAAREQLEVAASYP
jgi:hypothetical protein